MGTLGPAYQRFLAVSILGLLIWGVISWIILPIADGFSTRSEEIKDLQFRLVQLENVNERRDRDLPERLESIERYDALGLLLPEASERLATANLQARIGRMLDQRSVQIVSNQSVASKFESELTKISIRLRVVGDLESTQAALHAIELATPYLFVDELELRPSNRQASETATQLESSLSLSAYMLGDET